MDRFHFGLPFLDALKSQLLLEVFVYLQVEPRVVHIALNVVSLLVRDLRKNSEFEEF
jgi:hypothetical protein